jgi:hypothetical protein
VLPTPVSIRPGFDGASHHIDPFVAQHGLKGEAEDEGAASGQLNQQLRASTEYPTCSRVHVTRARALLESHSEPGEGTEFSTEDNSWLSSVVDFRPDSSKAAPPMTESG